MNKITNNLLADSGWISNCCSAGVNRDTELCLQCAEHCEAVCEYCETPEGEEPQHQCVDCGNEELSEKQCKDQQGLCMTCLRLLS